MSGLDNFIKRTLRCAGYCRYVDDMALFSDSRQELKDWQILIEQRLATKLRLRCHPSQVQAVSNGVPWLGFLVDAERCRLKSRKVVQASRKLSKAVARWRNGQLDAEKFDATLQGWMAHASHGDTRRLRFIMLKRLFER